jgi:hypothetical protein
LDCTNFSGVTLPAGLKSVGMGAFQGCEGIQSITFPAGLTEIEPWAFSGCNALQTVELPAGLKTVGEKAFYQCKTLKNATFKSDKTEIGAYCFAEDPVLETVELPKKNDSIANYLFQGCPAIKTFVIPDSVKTIGAGAFSYCSALESVTIPRSVEKVKAGAFYETALKTVDYRGTQTQWDALKGNISEYNDPLLKATLSVIPPLTLDAQTLSMTYKDVKTLKASRDVVWSSSDEKVAKVDAAGNVTASGKGQATVTATSEETGESVTCAVTVKYSFVQILIRIFLFGWIWY